MTRDEIELRCANHDDLKLLWDWANDPAVRAASFRPDPIEWDAHKEWLERRLDDPDCVIWIGHYQSKAFGQARFEKEQGETVVSISVDAPFRGRGLGTALIQRACAEVFARMRVGGIWAFIRPTNEASIRAFAKAGFRGAGITQVNHQPAVIYKLDCPPAQAGRDRN